MANYNESNVSGTLWQRCRTVTITNPLAGTETDPHTGEAAGPIAYFQEQEVVSLPGGRLIIKDIGGCKKAFSAQAQIALRDPATGELTGETYSHAALYAVLYSLYMQTALERDAG